MNQKTEGKPAKISLKKYLRELKYLHGELVALQRWVQREGLKVCIIFEGRDGAGKGGTIKAITERVSPRIFRTVALPTPTEREKSQIYLQRYIPHLPAAGEVVIFDRSWYNRAGVERVMGFCTEEDCFKFLTIMPFFEKALTDSGIILLKYWPLLFARVRIAPKRPRPLPAICKRCSLRAYPSCGRFRPCCAPVPASRRCVLQAPACCRAWFSPCLFFKISHTLREVRPLPLASSIMAARAVMVAVMRSKSSRMAVSRKCRLAPSHLGTW